jgi:hypothetical protein
LDSLGNDFGPKIAQVPADDLPSDEDPDKTGYTENGKNAKYSQKDVGQSHQQGGSCGKNRQTIRTKSRGSFLGALVIYNNALKLFSLSGFMVKYLRLPSTS